ncbi:MAG: recombinase family protein [Pseudomonadota bacterium]
MTTANWTISDNYIQLGFAPMAEVVVFGYARVSTEDQDFSLQIAALKDAGCECIFMEKRSTLKKRPVLEYLKGICCTEGLKFIVWRLDRLGRDLVEMVLTVQYFQERGVTLISLTENLTLDTAAGMLAFHILAAFAQYERNLISERTRAGIAIAKANGKQIGNPTKIHGEHRLEILVDIWNPDRRMTNKLIMARNGYGSTATLQKHFAGERGLMFKAKKQGLKKFGAIRRARLRKHAKAEGIQIYRLDQIAKERDNLGFDMKTLPIQSAA